jgi:hypothetical protein
MIAAVSGTAASFVLPLAPQASELLRTAEWAAGDAGAALTAAFLRLDQSLLAEENRQELKELAGGGHDGPGRR